MSNPLDRVLAALRAHGFDPKGGPKAYTCRCPGHDDSTPSLSITAGDDGRVLIHCHAGCPAEQVLASIGLKLSDLMPEDGRGTRKSHPPNRGHLRFSAKSSTSTTQEANVYLKAAEAVQVLVEKHGRVAGKWIYHSAIGEPVGVVLRWDLAVGGKEKRKKKILPVSKHGNQWFNRGMPEPRPLYGLPDLIKLQSGSLVIVTEGERKADLARELGFNATTSAHGAASAAKTDWSPLKDMKVVVMPDNDSAGDSFAGIVCRLVMEAGAEAACRVRLCDLWNELPKGGDLVDLVEHRSTDRAGLKTELDELIHHAEPIVAESADDTEPVLIRMSDVTPKPVHWIWRGKVARGKLTIVAGDPGTGKSLMTVDLAARLSRGNPLPGQAEGGAPAGIVMLNAEDDPEDTVQPRLVEAGADLRQITFVPQVQQRTRVTGKMEPRPFNLQTDLPQLEKAVRATKGCELVIVDPVTAYFGDADSHNAAETRAVLMGLADFARRMNVAVVAVSHLNKNEKGSAIYRVVGSISFVATARCALAVVKDKQVPDRRIVSTIKSNIGLDTTGWAYRVKSREPEAAPYCDWEPEPVLMSAQDTMEGSGDSGGQPELEDAVEWLRAVLADGSKASDAIKEEANKDGLQWRTVRRAQNLLKIKPKKTAFTGNWQWALPPQKREDAEDGQAGGSSPTGRGGGQ